MEHVRAPPLGGQQPDRGQHGRHAVLPGGHERHARRPGRSPAGCGRPSSSAARSVHRAAPCSSPRSASTTTSCVQARGPGPAHARMSRGRAAARSGTTPGLRTFSRLPAGGRPAPPSRALRAALRPVPARADRALRPGPSNRGAHGARRRRSGPRRLARSRLASLTGVFMSTNIGRCATGCRPAAASPPSIETFVRLTWWTPRCSAHAAGSRSGSRGGRASRAGRGSSAPRSTPRRRRCGRACRSPRPRRSGRAAVGQIAGHVELPGLDTRERRREVRAPATSVRSDAVIDAAPSSCQRRT